MRDLSYNLPSSLTATQRCWVNNFCLDHISTEDTSDDGLTAFMEECGRIVMEDTLAAHATEEATLHPAAASPADAAAVANENHAMAKERQRQQVRLSDEKKLASKSRRKALEREKEIRTREEEDASRAAEEARLMDEELNRVLREQTEKAAAVRMALDAETARLEAQL